MGQRSYNDNFMIIITYSRTSTSHTSSWHSSIPVVNRVSQSVAEEDGCDWGGTVGVSHVYPNRDVLKDCHARGGTCPWCPPGSATYVSGDSGMPATSFPMSIRMVHFYTTVGSAIQIGDEHEFIWYPGRY